MRFENIRRAVCGFAATVPLLATPAISTAQVTIPPSPNMPPRPDVTVLPSFMAEFGKEHPDASLTELLTAMQRRFGDELTPYIESALEQLSNLTVSTTLAEFHARNIDTTPNERIAGLLEARILGTYNCYWDEKSNSFSVMSHLPAVKPNSGERDDGRILSVNDTVSVSLRRKGERISGWEKDYLYLPTETMVKQVVPLPEGCQTEDILEVRRTLSANRTSPGPRAAFSIYFTVDANGGLNRCERDGSLLNPSGAILIDGIGKFDWAKKQASRARQAEEDLSRARKQIIGSSRSTIPTIEWPQGLTTDAAPFAISGGELTFSGPTVLDFYAVWCPPCNAGLPKLNELAAKNKDFAFYLMVRAESDVDLKGLATRLSEIKEEYPHLNIRLVGEEARNRFNVIALPTTVVVDDEVVKDVSLTMEDLTSACERLKKKGGT